MKQIQKLYEMKGVFGDKTKYDMATDRFNAMLSEIDMIENPLRILDVGCGTGYFASVIKRRFPDAEVYGTDISHAAINRGTKLYPDIRLVQSDANRKLPFKPNFFDLVISGEHIAHLSHVDTYMSELYRVLAPTGYLLVTTPNLASWLNRILLLFGKTPFFVEPSFVKAMPNVSLLGKTFPDPHLPPSGHLRLFTLPMLLFLLSLHGFKIKKSLGVSSLSHPLIKPIDRLFNFVPHLSSGLIVVSEKPR